MRSGTGAVVPRGAWASDEDTVAHRTKQAGGVVFGGGADGRAVGLSERIGQCGRADCGLSRPHAGLNIRRSRRPRTNPVTVRRDPVAAPVASQSQLPQRTALMTQPATTSQPSPAEVLAQLPDPSEAERAFRGTAREAAARAGKSPGPARGAELRAGGHAGPRVPSDSFRASASAARVVGVHPAGDREQLHHSDRGPQPRPSARRKLSRPRPRLTPSSS